MAFKKIKKPQDASFSTGNGSVSLVWNPKISDIMNAQLLKRQMIIDSEVLRRCAPMVPKRTGALERSGIEHTIIGTGEVKYGTPYAARQYYNTADYREYDPRRGGMWFERMKVAQKAAILQAANGGKK